MSLPLHYLAIDVGTGSARAALFTASGRNLAHATHPIITRHTRPDYYEQSTTDIWHAITRCVASLRHQCPNAHIAALAVDATCSLAVVSATPPHLPLSVSENVKESENGNHNHHNHLTYNVILWLDRRATSDAAAINAMPDPSVVCVRNVFGGALSPESQPPKLRFLHRHKPHLVRDALFFDLADWITFQCCADPTVRSACTVASKWAWGSHHVAEWSPHFWPALGLSAFSHNSFRKIGTRIIPPGRPVANLCPQAATTLGLSPSCVVAAPMVDAYAGALWALAVRSPELTALAPHLHHRLSAVCGSSTCFIQLSSEPYRIRGVWGPFHDAILPHLHVSEGGQSASGLLLDHIVRTHPAHNALCTRVGAPCVFDELARLTQRVVDAGEPDPATHVHCLDYHAGNRSPRADPALKGTMVGLSLAGDEFDLAVAFRAAVQALCYGARHIVEAMRAGGHDVRVVMACGGLCKSRLFLRELADAIALPVVLSSEPDTVLLGGAILARTAHVVGEANEDVGAAILKIGSEMAQVGEVIVPDEKRREYHDRKYKVYLEMHADSVKYRRIMEGGSEVES